MSTHSSQDEETNYEASLIRPPSSRPADVGNDAHAMPTLQELAAILGRIHNSPDKYIFDIWADPAVRSIPPPPDVDPATIWKPFEDWARGHSELLQRIQYQAAYEDWARRDSERIRTGGQESDEPMSPISERSGSEETAVAPMENLAICDDGQESDTEPSCREETAVAPRENLAIRDSFTTHVSKTLAVARVPPEQRPPESSNRRENKTESPAPAADGPHPPRHVSIKSVSSGPAHSTEAAEGGHRSFSPRDGASIWLEAESSRRVVSEN